MEEAKLQKTNRKKREKYIYHPVMVAKKSFGTDHEISLTEVKSKLAGVY